MVHHSELINLISDQIKAKSYLEIGTFNRDHNFNKINCEFKICVDPDPAAKPTHLMTSDDFFDQNQLFFDLTFIDGKHEKFQAKRDLINAWMKTNTNGVILLHDCNPPAEITTHYPRDNREWCGDVFQMICQIISPKMTVNFDYGVCVIQKQKVSQLIFDTERYCSWSYFSLYKEELLKLISVEEAVNQISNWDEIPTKFKAHAL